MKKNYKTADMVIPGLVLAPLLSTALARVHQCLRASAHAEHTFSVCCDPLLAGLGSRGSNMYPNAGSQNEDLLAALAPICSRRLMITVVGLFGTVFWLHAFSSAALQETYTAGPSPIKPSAQDLKV